MVRDQPFELCALGRFVVVDGRGLGVRVGAVCGVGYRAAEVCCWACEEWGCAFVDGGLGRGLEGAWGGVRAGGCSW